MKYTDLINEEAARHTNGEYEIQVTVEKDKKTFDKVYKFPTSDILDIFYTINKDNIKKMKWNLAKPRKLSDKKIKQYTDFYIKQMTI